MSFFRFTAPPLPHYVSCGEDTYRAGQIGHPTRTNFKVFDMLIVTRGCLPMKEDDGHWRIGPGYAFILQPGKTHDQVEPCPEETHFFWMHFHILSEMKELMNWNPAQDLMPQFPHHQIKMFTMALPQFVRLKHPDRTFEKMRLLISLQRHDNYLMKWQQQIICQQILQELSDSGNPHGGKSITVAHRTAEYLRMHYQEDITNATLQHELHYHPVYISRCMKSHYHVTPLTYLHEYRIERSKLLLMNTDIPIKQIAETVGFKNPAYFALCFGKQEGLSPLAFRKRFRAP